MIPGEFFIEKGDIECNAGRDTLKIKVANTGDRPIQVGSHCHFFEVNRAMSFEREKAFGKRLNIASGTAVRFEPGEIKEIELVSYGGLKKAFGHNNLVNGDTTSSTKKEESLLLLKKENFNTQ